MPLTTSIAESSNITRQKNSSSNISLHNLTVALKLTIQAKKTNKTVASFLALFIGFIWALALASLVGVIYNI